MIELLVLAAIAYAGARGVESIASTSDRRHDSPAARETVAKVADRGPKDKTAKTKEKEAPGPTDPGGTFSAVAPRSAKLGGKAAIPLAVVTETGSTMWKAAGEGYRERWPEIRAERRKKMAARAARKKSAKDKADAKRKAAEALKAAGPPPAHPPKPSEPPTVPAELPPTPAEHRGADTERPSAPAERPGLDTDPWSDEEDTPEQNSGRRLLWDELEDPRFGYGRGLNPEAAEERVKAAESKAEEARKEAEAARHREATAKVLAAQKAEREAKEREAAAEERARAAEERAASAAQKTTEPETPTGHRHLAVVPDPDQTGDLMSSPATLIPEIRTLDGLMNALTLTRAMCEMRAEEAEAVAADDRALSDLLDRIEGQLTDFEVDDKTLQEIALLRESISVQSRTALAYSKAATDTGAFASAAAAAAYKSHGGIAEAVQSSPIELAAQAGYYEN
ncbi:hypothetical protein [Streptomyces sp. NPDC088707]|uniref:hypothetical protein n=1 Tax=Streptomyces sp. NPDC088707 TaxID=3365871 RepID=UPI00383013B3